MECHLRIHVINFHRRFWHDSDLLRKALLFHHLDVLIHILSFFLKFLKLIWSLVFVIGSQICFSALTWRVSAMNDTFNGTQQILSNHFKRILALLTVVKCLGNTAFFDGVFSNLCPILLIIPFNYRSTHHNIHHCRRLCWHFVNSLLCRWLSHLTLWLVFLFYAFTLDGEIKRPFWVLFHDFKRILVILLLWLHHHALITWYGRVLNESCICNLSSTFELDLAPMLFGQTDCLQTFKSRIHDCLLVRIAPLFNLDFVSIHNLIHMRLTHHFQIHYCIFVLIFATPLHSRRYAIIENSPLHIITIHAVILSEHPSVLAQNNSKGLVFGIVYSHATFMSRQHPTRRFKSHLRRLLKSCIARCVMKRTSSNKSLVFWWAGSLIARISWRVYRRFLVWRSFFVFDHFSTLLPSFWSLIIVSLFNIFFFFGTTFFLGSIFLIHRYRHSRMQCSFALDNHFSRLFDFSIHSV